MCDEHAWIFFSPIKKKQRDLDYQACSSDMVGYNFQGFNSSKKIPTHVHRTCV